MAERFSHSCVVVFRMYLSRGVAKVPLEHFFFNGIEVVTTSSHLLFFHLLFINCLLQFSIDLLTIHETSLY